MPLSKNQAARARQLANLKSTGALKHGARSEGAIRPRADELFAELLEEFPNGSVRVLRLQARRLSKLEGLGRFLEERGELRNRRLGELFPAAAMEESLTVAFLNTQAKLEAQQREAAGKPAAGLEALRAKGAQIARDREDREVPNGD